MKVASPRKTPPGLEAVILRKLPYVLATATVVPLLMSGLSRLFPGQGTAADLARAQADVDILAVSIAVTTWTMALPVAIGCVCVWIMKGPTYTADSYEVPDSDQPAARERRGNDSSLDA